jgi:putative endopeptidase
MAWKDETKDKNLQPVDGLTPEQRFFIGFAQWDCANERPEDLRVRAATDPHSPAQYRINGVVVNMPEFSKAFSCKAGQPMTKSAEKVCKVW